tara:strand:+ start:850 stop:1488 length:639 start_codon:yes stop_codon:yes gene_type:complete
VSIKLIIFDFDGTICDSLEAKKIAFENLYKPYGKEIVKRVSNHHTQNLGISREEKLRFIQKEILSQDHSEVRIKELSKNFSKLVKQHVIDAPFIKGALDFLKKNSRNYELHISSATPQEELLDILKAKNLSSYFLSINGSPRKKFEHIKTILHKNRIIKRNEVVFIGDSMQDQLAAKKAEVNFIGIGSSNVFSSEEKRIDDFRALESTLKEF